MTKKKIKDKEERFNKFGSVMIMEKYRASNDIDIFFPEYNYTVEHVQYYSFKEGIIKCPYEPRVYGKGFLGEGPYKSKANNKDVEAYKIWYDMLKRCYDLKYQEKRPTYVGCEVCDEWLNYQNFARWYEENYYEVQGQRMELDKDILIKGNKVYSPDNCIFVPHIINSLFIKCDTVRGEYPVGITLNKRDNKLQVRCRIYENGKMIRKHLGYFNVDQTEEAFFIYKTVKESNIKTIADQYKDLIPEILYNAMYEYEVEWED